MQLPLEDIKVLDLSHALAGPFCSTMLADFGAQVIKLEPPGAMRTPAPTRGQHTAEVLRDVLGMNADEIAALEVAGAIGVSARFARAVKDAGIKAG